MLNKIQNSKKNIGLFAVKSRKMASVSKMFDFEKIKKKDEEKEVKEVKE